MTAALAHQLAIVLVAWLATLALRSFPFVLFGRAGSHPPAFVRRISGFISPIIIFGLIVYSYAGLRYAVPAPWLAGALTVGLQLVFRQPLVSILAGTVLYMVLIAPLP